MASKVLPGDKISDASPVGGADHAAWKRAKIENGLTQSADRSQMIPAEEVWRKLGLER